MTAIVSASFYITGGTVPRDAACYVPRQADLDLLEGLRQGQFCYVLTARQMGKSSLMVRTATKLRQEGVTCVILDLTAIGQNLDAERWYGGLLNQLGQQVELEDDLDDAWLEPSSLGPMQKWMKCLHEVVLKGRTNKLVIFIDEIDAVRSLPFSADEFFAGIRECYNRRTEDHDFFRLSLCLLGVATPADLIRDPRTTPFNIGKRIELTDFTEAEAHPLTFGFTYLLDGEPVFLQNAESEALLKRVLHWTGGHPYLTQRLCSALAQQAPTSCPGNALVDQLCSDLFFSSSARERDDNLLYVRERLLRSDVDIAGLLLLYRQVWEGKRVPVDETNALISLLRLSGITQVSRGLLKPRNRIYAHVFDKAWVESHLPDADVQRQKAAYRQGVRRTMAMASAIFAMMAGLVLFAFEQRDEARRYAATARRNEARERTATAEARRQADAAELSSYFAKMNLIQRDWDNDNVGHVLQLLEETKSYPERGFEWGYWNRLCHLYLMTLNGHTDYVSSVAFSLDGKRIVTGSKDKTAKVWDAQTGEATLTLKGHTGPIPSVAFSPDCRHIVTGSWDKTAKVWDAQTGHETLTLKGHAEDVISVAYSPNGKRIVTGSEDNSAKVWDAQTGRETLTLKGHTGFVKSVAFSPDGKRIVTGSGDNTARIWDAYTGQEKRTLKGHSNRVMSATFSPDGRRIVTGSGDNTANVWVSDPVAPQVAAKVH